MGTQTLKIGGILLQDGLITQDQLSKALELQKEGGKKLGEILIEQKMIDEYDFLKVLANTFQVPMVDLMGLSIDDKLMNLFPPQMLKEHRVLPLEIEDNSLVIAISDPLNVMSLQEIQRISGYRVKPVLAALKDIMGHLNKSQDKMEAYQAIRYAQTSGPAETPIVKLVNSILSKAVKEGASDIHLEPQKENLRVRFRLDGMLFTKFTVPLELSRKVISRVKIMAGMDVAESRRPQDGRISWNEGTHQYDIRVSTLLDKHGETIALRILNTKSTDYSFDSLGLEAKEIKLIKDLVLRPYGIFLITGPTGSGKTTTLYSVLNSLNDISSNIITVEDPLEYQMEGITQTNINLHVNYTFASAIRQILRHDPDIIMVGEIRDVETAEVAVRAALTGHLVLSTLHTNSAAGAITRLLEMKVESFLLSSSIVGVIAQRLVRKLCPLCKKIVQAQPDIEQVILSELGMSGPISIAQAVGCEKCFQTGYSGRVGLFEILAVNREVRGLILKSASDQEITAAMVAKGMRTLRMAGYQKVVNQVTSYEEVIRVTLTEDM